jgi:hypothetical protein
MLLLSAMPFTNPEHDKPAQVTSERLAWSLNDIHERTGLSLGFLRNEVRAGRLATRKFGRRVLVIDVDLRRYLTQGSPGHKAKCAHEGNGAPCIPAEEERTV